MTDNQTTKHRTVIYLFGAGLAISIILRLLPLLFPDSRMWGFNHLLYSGAVGRAAFCLLILVSVLTLFNPIRRIASNLFDSTARYFFAEQNRIKWLVIGVVVVPIFWIFRMPTNLLGDGYTLIHNLGNELPVIFKWSETGAIKMAYYISRILRLEGLDRGLIGYGIVSVLSGGATLYFFARISHELTTDNAGRLFSFLLLIFSGWMLLFFGYAENYPILWPFVTGYICFSVRYIKGSGSLLFPALFLAMALLLHLQLLFFSISFLPLLFVRGAGLRFFKKYRSLVIGLLSLGFVMAIIIFYLKYQSSLSFRLHFLPPFAGRPIAPDYAIFSLTHVTDILNELLLLIPLLLFSPLLLIAPLRRRWRFFEDGVDLFLISFAVGGFVLLLMLDPRIGMGRDWDLFALTGLAPMLYLIKKVNVTEKAQRFYPSLAILALALCLPFFATNLSYQSSLDYATSLLNLDKSRSRSGMSMVRDYYHNQGEVEKADSVNAVIITAFSEIKMIKQAAFLLRKGQLREADRIADSLYSLNPFSKELSNLRGALAVQAGKYDEAIDIYKQLIELEQYDPGPLTSIAIAYQRTGRYREMFSNLRAAQKLDPDQIKMLEGFALGFYLKKQYDSAYHYGLRIIEVNPDNPNGYLGAGTAAFQLRKMRQAEKYLKEYMQIAPEVADKMSVAGMYDQAVQYLKKSGSSP